MTLRAPFPYFGGKHRAAQIIWHAIGDLPIRRPRSTSVTVDDTAKESLRRRGSGHMRTWPIYGAEHHVTAGGGAGVVFCDACAEINTDGELILPCSPDDPCRCCMHAHIRALNEEIRSRRAQAETDRRVFDKVQSLHHNNGGERWCVTCEGQEWPCETHLALEEDDL